MAIAITPYLITLSPSTYTAADLYGAWVTWVSAGNANYYPAFRQSGGASLIGSDIQPLYLFLQNQYGWRITSSDPTQWVTLDCNLYGEDAGESIYTLVAGVQPPIQIERSVKAAAVASGSALNATQSDQLSAIYKANMHKRVRDPNTKVITIYESDGNTPFAEFDSNSDISSITPK